MTSRQLRDAMFALADIYRARGYSIRVAARKAALAIYLVAALLVSPRAAHASGCFASDVRATCCPSACAARDSAHWYRADAVLRGCMQGLGCDAGAVRTASVTMRCECRR